MRRSKGTSMYYIYSSGFLRLYRYKRIRGRSVFKSRVYTIYSSSSLLQPSKDSIYYITSKLLLSF